MIYERHPAYTRQRRSFVLLNCKVFIENKINWSSNLVTRRKLAFFTERCYKRASNPWGQRSIFLYYLPGRWRNPCKKLSHKTKKKLPHCAGNYPGRQLLSIPTSSKKRGAYRIECTSRILLISFNTINKFITIHLHSNCLPRNYRFSSFHNCSIFSVAYNIKLPKWKK